MAAVHERFQQYDAVCLRGTDHLHTFRFGYAHWLFAEDVLSSTGGRQNAFAMDSVWGGHVNRVNIRIFEERLVSTKGFWKTVLGCKAFRCFRGATGNAILLSSARVIQSRGEDTGDLSGPKNSSSTL